MKNACIVFLHIKYLFLFDLILKLIIHLCVTLKVLLIIHLCVTLKVLVLRLLYFSVDWIYELCRIFNPISFCSYPLAFFVPHNIYYVLELYHFITEYGVLNVVKMLLYLVLLQHKSHYYYICFFFLSQHMYYILCNVYTGSHHWFILRPTHDHHIAVHHNLLPIHNIYIIVQNNNIFGLS